MSAGKRFVKHDELQTLLRRLEYRLRQSAITPPAAEAAPSTVTPIDTSGFERLINKGQASGYCELDAGVLVPLNRLPAIAKTPDLWHYRLAGDTIWHFPSYTNLGISTGSPVLDIIYAYPLICPKTITASGLRTAVSTTVADKVGRLGIYNDDGIKPGSLLIDAGEFLASGSNGFRILVINQQLIGPALYWLAFTATGAIFQSFIVTNTLPVLGSLQDAAWPAAAKPIVGYYGAQAYGPLPANFPSPTLLVDAPFPIVRVRLSVA